MSSLGDRLKRATVDPDQPEADSANDAGAAATPGAGTQSLAQSLVQHPVQPPAAPVRAGDPGRRVAGPPGGESSLGHRKAMVTGHQQDRFASFAAEAVG